MTLPELSTSLSSSPLVLAKFAAACWTAVNDKVCVTVPALAESRNPPVPAATATIMAGMYTRALSFMSTSVCKVLSPPASQQNQFIFQLASSVAGFQDDTWASGVMNICILHIFM